MSQPRRSNPTSTSQPSVGPDGPILLPSERSRVRRELQGRLPAFTPDWAPAAGDLEDAGLALLTLFSEQAEPVLQRLNKLPLKARIEALRIANLLPIPAAPASVLLEFNVQDTATDSALVPAGTQVGGHATAGAGGGASGGGLVIFETVDDLFATAAKITQRRVQEGTIFRDIGPPSADFSPFQPFGDRPAAGRALYLGLTAPAPQSQLSIGIEIDAAGGVTPPVAMGGLAPLPIAPGPVVSWEVYDGRSLQYVPARIKTDETGGLLQGGLVVLELPANWGKGRPAGIDAPDGLFWIRVRIAQGEFERAPVFRDLRLNMVRGVAAETILDEPLDFGVDATQRRTAVLSRSPVLRDSVRVTVVGSTLAGGDPVLWQRSDDLVQEAPDALMYELDPGTGELRFGNGVAGAAVPPGFRNVFVTYQAVSVASGGFEAGAVNVLLQTVPFLTGVNNPRAASAGSDLESEADAIRRGPQVLRARGRAVTEADFALLALEAPGAQVVRARAIAGRHAAYPGRNIPGVVGVFIVPPDLGGGTPPVPIEEALRNVARSLSETAAPAGIDVVVAAPRYRYVRCRVAVVMTPGRRAFDVLDAITTYLHPIIGGDDGQGWPFGRTLAYKPLLMFLMKQVAGLTAVPKLLMEVDDLRIDPCADVPIEDDALFWSLRHELLPDDEGGSP